MASSGYDSFHVDPGFPHGTLRSIGQQQPSAGLPDLGVNYSAPMPSKRPSATIKPAALRHHGAPASGTTGYEAAPQQTSPVYSPSFSTMGGMMPSEAPSSSSAMYGAGGATSSAAPAAQPAAASLSHVYSAMSSEQLQARMMHLMGELQTIMAEMNLRGLSAASGTAGGVPSPTSAAFPGMPQPQPQQSAAPVAMPPAMHVDHMPPASPSMAVPRVGSAGGSAAPSGMPTHHHAVAPAPVVHHQQVQRQHQQQQQRQMAGPPQLPSGRRGQAVEATVILVVVEFKLSRLKKYESSTFIAPGTYVLVDGDRGTDCGLVVCCCERRADGSVVRSDSVDKIDMSRLKPVSGHVKRPATDPEIAMLHGEIAAVERQSLQRCRELAEQMNINMTVLECEFQFDRKKVTFYFDSEGAVDFRELARELYKTHNSRIWLENVNTKVKNVVPDGALSQADKMLYIERGIRPPRPTQSPPVASAVATTSSGRREM